MEGVNTKYYIKLEVLSPLHIGTGEKLKHGVDFVCNKGKVYHLNMRKLGRKYHNLADYLVGSNIEEVLMPIINAEKIEDYSIASWRYQGLSGDLSLFVKNQYTQCPVLLGSSLKGAIRSHLFNTFKKETNDSENNEKNLFGSSNDGDEFMRFFKIADVEFLKTGLVNTKIHNLRKEDDAWAGGWKNSGKETTEKLDVAKFNTICECLLPKQVAVTTIDVSETQFNLFDIDRFYEKQIEDLREETNKEIDSNKRQELERKINVYTNLQQTINSKKKYLKLSDLFSLINEKTKSYIDKEIDYFKNYYEADDTDLILESLDSLRDSIKDDNSCVLKMSFGSGFHSITGDWQFDDFFSGTLDRKRNKDAKSKSRKIAIWSENEKRKMSLMGFVKLSITNEDDYNNYWDSLLRARKPIIEKTISISSSDNPNVPMLTEWEKFVQNDLPIIHTKLNSIKKKEALEAISECECMIAKIDVDSKNSGDAISKIRSTISALKGRIQDIENVKQSLSQYLDEQNLKGEYKVKKVDKIFVNKIECYLRDILGSKNAVLPVSEYETIKNTLIRIGALNKLSDKEIQILKKWVDDKHINEWK